MFAKKATMRICRFCKAPNPERLTECYACGGSLTAPDPSLPREGETTFPCLNCQGAIPYRATSCPHCGRSLAHEERSKEQMVRAATPPDGWKAQPLPDGTVVLRRTAWNRWLQSMIISPGLPINAVTMPGVASLVLAVMLFMPHRFAERGMETSDAAYWVLGSCATLCFLWFLIALLMNEEIRLGKDFLEVRRDLWFYHANRRIETGFLRVTTDHRTVYSRYGSRGDILSLATGSTQHIWVRTLHASNAGVSLRLHQTSQTAMLWDGDGAGRGFACDDISQLSLYIADITGWQVFDNSAQRYGK